MNYGTALPEWFYIPKSAFWLRKDLGDANPFGAVEIRSGDIVMDCGAYIGTFAVAAVEQGAPLAVCYEAAPKNAAILRQNSIRYGAAIRVVESALVANGDKTTRLTLSGFSGAHSILPSKRPAKTLCVSSVNFRQELQQLRPNVLKLDVEGAEYSLFASLQVGDLESVSCLFIEFHPIENRDEQIAVIRKFIESEGLTVISARRRAFVALRQTESNTDES